MASHVSNLATNYEDRTPIHSWVTSYNVSHWLPLKMRTHAPNHVTREYEVKNYYIFGIRYPDLLIRYTNSVALASTMKIIKVICENNARPWVKKRMSFCACAKSRDLLKVPWMSYCSRSRRRRFTVLGFKSWAVYSIYGHFQQHFTAHALKRLFIIFRCKFRHHRSIPRPIYPLECEISAIWRRFPLILHFVCWKSAIYLLPVCLAHWPRKCTIGVDSHCDNFLQVWS